ncbi:MAG: hypothetical protein RR225_04560 [Clostridium sp.]
MNSFMMAATTINTPMEGNSPAVAIAMAIAGFCVGIVQLMWGYKLKRFWIAFQGLMMGGVLGYLIGRGIGYGGVVMILIGLAVGAVLGTWFAYRFYKLGVFLICFFVTFVVGLIVVAIAGLKPGAIWICLFLGILVGGLGVVLTKPMFIITTAIGGGFSCGMALGGLTKIDLIGLVLSIALSAFGLWYQITHNDGLLESREEKEKRKEKERHAAKKKQEKEQHNMKKTETIEPEVLNPKAEQPIETPPVIEEKVEEIPTVEPTDQE